MANDKKFDDLGKGTEKVIQDLLNKNGDIVKEITSLNWAEHKLDDKKKAAINKLVQTKEMAAVRQVGVSQKMPYFSVGVTLYGGLIAGIIGSIAGVYETKNNAYVCEARDSLVKIGLVVDLGVHLSIGFYDRHPSQLNGHVGGFAASVDVGAGVNGYWYYSLKNNGAFHAKLGSGIGIGLSIAGLIGEHHSF